MLRCVSTSRVLCLQVSQHSLQNRMSCSSLACVFGVSLLRPPAGPLPLEHLDQINLFTQILLEHFHPVFGSRCPPEHVDRHTPVQVTP